MTDDDLDRAIFELPLAQPPARLRAAILASTVYAPRRSALWFVDTLVAGVLLAIVTWIALAVAGGGGPVSSAIFAAVGKLGETLSDREVLVWLALGGATALWMTLSGGRLVSLPRR